MQALYSFPGADWRATLNPSWNPGVHFHDAEKEKKKTKNSLKKILYWEEYREIWGGKYLRDKKTDVIQGAWW